MTDKQVELLRVAEESYMRAGNAILLILKPWVYETPDLNFKDFCDRAEGALKLLEKAITAHNVYAESVK